MESGHKVKRAIAVVLAVFAASTLSGQQLIPPTFWQGPIIQPDGFNPLMVFAPFAEAAENLRWLFVVFGAFPLWLAWAYKMNNAQSGHEMNQGVITIVLCAVFMASVPLATATFNTNLVDPIASFTREGQTRVQMISRIWEMSTTFQAFDIARPTEEEQKQIDEATIAYETARANYQREQDENKKKQLAAEEKKSWKEYANLVNPFNRGFWMYRAGRAVKDVTAEAVDEVIDPINDGIFQWYMAMLQKVYVWIVAALFSLILAICWFIAAVFEMARQGLLIGMSIMLPFFIGCLPNRTLGSHGRTFVFQFIGVCMWPIGYAIVDLGAMKIFEGFLILLVEPLFNSAKFAGGGETTWSLSEQILTGHIPIGVTMTFAETSDMGLLAKQYGVPLPAPNAANLLALRCWMDPFVPIKGLIWLIFLFAWVIIGTAGVPIAMGKLAQSGASMFLSTGQTAADTLQAFSKEKLNAMLRSGGGGGGGGATPPLTPQAIGKAVADALRGGGGSGGGGPSDVGGSDLPPSTPPSGGGDIPGGGGSSGGSSGGSGGGSSGGSGGGVPPFLATPVAVASAADKVASSGVRATGNAVSSGMDKVGDAMSSEQSGSTGGGKGSQDFWTKSYQSAYGSSGGSGSGSGDDAGVSGGAVGESQTTARRRVHVRTERDDDGDGGAVTSALRSGSESSQQTRRVHVRTERDDDGDGGAVIRRGISDSSASSQSESIIRRGR